MRSFGCKNHNYLNRMELLSKPRVHNLNLNYNEYLKSGKTIANTQIDKYIVYDQLGKGAFGSVYKGMDDQTKNIVAIKVLDLHAIEKEPNERIRDIKRRLSRTQSQLMMVCSSQNVVKCYNVYENRSLKIIVMEYCNGGQLQRQISKKITIPEREATLILKQVINGIRELHTHNIIHRDLKAQNILSHNGVYKIADLGFSKQINEDQLKQTTLGTISTMAPEVMKKQPYGLKADIWSIGVIFFQMVFGKLPYLSTNAITLYHQIQTKNLLQTDQFEFNNIKASRQVTSFLRQVLTVNKKKRLGWKELVNHPLFVDKSERLSNQFFLNVQLHQPNINLSQNVENDCFQNQEQQLLDDVKGQHLQNAHQLIRLTQAQVNNKIQKVQNGQDVVYEWVKQTHIECLKTELIYNEIFLVIEHYKLLDLSERAVVEFMYLVLTRCLNNISVINDKIQNEKKYTHILQNLQQNVKYLYDKITSAWNRYAKRLTECENKIGNIINDRFSKIFKSKSIEEKDKFLTGIEKMYYTKKEQIQFTDEEYITGVKKEMKTQPEKASKKVKNYLAHYVQINIVKRSDLKQRSFKEYVEMILQ